MEPKPKIAIYDFTDCEGCEVELISLREKFLELEKQIDIVDWRLGQERKSPVLSNVEGFDIALIEGVPITQDEIDTLKYLRENSKLLIALGACASVAGIPGIMDKEKRAEWYKKIYSPEYKPKGIDALPLSAYVKVDFAIHGCPVNKNEIARIMEEILAGKKPAYRPYSVCFDCKVAGNKCRIVNKKPCLGPITQGGCEAVCVSGGSPCYGCFGIREEANVEGLKKILEKMLKEAPTLTEGEVGVPTPEDVGKEVERYMTMFLNKEKN